MSYNYSIMDAEANRAVIEASSEGVMIRKNSVLFCTNHFQSSDMQKYNRESIDNSTGRLDVLQTLRNKNSDRLQAFHQFNEAESPLCFHDYQHAFGTLHTVVYSPQDLTVITGIGGNNNPLTFSFKQWLDSTSKLPEKIEGVLQ